MMNDGFLSRVTYKIHLFLVQKWRLRVTAGLVVGAIAFGLGRYLIYRTTSECGWVHFAIQLSGSTEELQKTLSQGCTADIGQFRWSLGADVLFIIGYWLLSTTILAASWWRYEAVALKRATPLVVLLPTFVAVLDLIENALSLRFVELTDDGLYRYVSDIAGVAISCVAWMKWLLVVPLLAAVVMGLSIWYSRRKNPIPETVEGLVTTESESRSPTPDTSPSGKHGNTQPAANDTAVGVETTKEPVPRPAVAEDSQASSALVEENGGVGVCFSGGGIRSAAFALGVLSALEEGKVMDEARYVTAVSGGAWAATAWTLQKAFQDNDTTAGKTSDSTAKKVNGATAKKKKEEDNTTAGRVIAGLETRAAAGATRQKYLLNGAGGILGPLIWVLGCAATSLALVGALIFALVWPMGWLLGSRVAFPELTEVHAKPPSAGQTYPMTCTPKGDTVQCTGKITAPSEATDIGIAEWSYQPGLWILAIGVLLLLVCGFWNRVARWWPAGAVVAAAGLTLLAYLTVVPELIKHLAERDMAGFTSIVSAVGASVLVTVVSGLWRVVGKPATTLLGGAIATHLPKLFGIVLVVGGLAWSLAVMYLAATRTWEVWAVCVPLGLLVVMYSALSPNWPSLHNIFGERLRRSFDPTAYPLDPTQPPNSKTWKELAEKTRSSSSNGKVPELILCCAQQRNGLSAGGLPAESFTISPSTVRQGAIEVSTEKYLAATEKVKRLKRVQEFSRQNQLSGWLATTGAAFSSAMGRSSLGSTNAFLAAVNADLGLWLPNPKIVQANARMDDEDVRRLFPRPRFAYVLKEILGWYNSDDRFVFVTDGGHWENLGLVELLRLRCDVIVCVDASGDPKGSFATLREALELESLLLDNLTLDSALDSVLESMRPQSDALPATITATIEAKYKNGGRVRIHYTKLQATQQMSRDLRLFALADKAFPTYSTVRQFLSNEQFGMLVDLGRFAGTEVMGSMKSSERSARSRMPRPNGRRGRGGQFHRAHQ